MEGSVPLLAALLLVGGSAGLHPNLVASKSRLQAPSLQFASEHGHRDSDLAPTRDPRGGGKRGDILSERLGSGRVTH